MKNIQQCQDNKYTYGDNILREFSQLLPSQFGKPSLQRRLSTLETDLLFGASLTLSFMTLS